MQEESNNIITTEREPLRWLFTAEYEDGTTVVQDPNDTCKTRDDGTGSAFTDVLKVEEDKKLVAFHLDHVNGKESASVDLLTGAFIVNGTPLNIHDQNFAPELHPLRLIYHRETRIDQEIKATVEDDGSVTQEDVGDPRHFVNRYFIGWQTTVNGKNKQATIAVGQVVLYGYC